MIIGILQQKQGQRKFASREGNKAGRISVNNAEIRNNDKFGILDKLILQQGSLQMKKMGLSEIEFILDFF